MKIPSFRIAVLSFVALGAVGLAQEGAKPGYGAKKEGPEKKAEKKAEEAKQVAVTGEVVNLACPLHADSTAGPKHVCSPSCLKDRAWAGVIDETTGALYIAHGKDGASAADRLATWAGQRVTIKGRATEANGLRALGVEDVAKASGAKPEGKAAEASAPKPREGTVTGSVVNVLCALEMPSDGNLHTCDATCLKGDRILVGVRDDASGKIYVAFAPAAAAGAGAPKPAVEQLRPLAGSKARVAGKIVGNLIEVTKAEKA